MAKFQYINLPNTAGINLAFDSETSGLFYAQSVSITGTSIWNPVTLALPKDVAQFIQITDANKDSVANYIAEKQVKNNTLFVDEYGQAVLYLAATSSIIDISVEYIENANEITSSNSGNLITVNALSGYLESKLKEFEEEQANDKFITSAKFTNDLLTLIDNTGGKLFVNIPLSAALSDTSGQLQTNINGKLNITDFNSVSGKYIGADNKLSSDLTSAFTKADETLSSNLLETINELNTRFTLSGDHNNSEYASVYTLTYDGVQIGEQINIPKDQFLTSATYIPAEEVLRLTFKLNVEGGETNTVDIPVGDLIDEYSEGNGITITNQVEGKNIVSINVAPSGTNDNKFINLTSGGLGLSGITEFVNSVSGQLQANINLVESTPFVQIERIITNNNDIKEFAKIILNGLNTNR